MNRLTSILLMAVLAACGEAAVPAPDQPFPASQLVDVEGGAARLAAEPGEVLVVNFWATWCAPCRRELPALEQLAAALPDGIRLEGVAVGDRPGLVAEYRIAHGVSFARLVEPDRRRARTGYGIDALPQTLIVGPDGRIVARLVGERSWPVAAWRERLVRLREDGIWRNG